MTTKPKDDTARFTEQDATGLFVVHPPKKQKPKKRKIKVTRKPKQQRDDDHDYKD